MFRNFGLIYESYSLPFAVRVVQGEFDFQLASLQILPTTPCKWPHITKHVCPCFSPQILNLILHSHK